MSKLYRYFSNCDWAESFLQGQLYFQQLSYFVSLENSTKADEMEGSRCYSPQNGLQINFGENVSYNYPVASLVSTVRAIDSIFILCTSTELDKTIASKFNATVCVEINDVSSFCRLLSRNIPQGAHIPILGRRSRIGNHVSYYEEVLAPDVSHELPEKIVFEKRKEYSSEKEYRFAFSDGINAFLPNDVTYSIQFDQAPRTITSSRSVSGKVIDIGKENASSLLKKILL